MGTLTVEGMSAGLISGENIIGPYTMTGNNTVGQRTDVTLGSGDNSFTLPPSGAIAVGIFLGSTPITVKVRTNLNSGDAGLPIGPASGQAWAVFPLPTGSTTLIINASGSLPSVELVYI